MSPRTPRRPPAPEPADPEDYRLTPDPSPEPAKPAGQDAPAAATAADQATSAGSPAPASSTPAAPETPPAHLANRNPEHAAAAVSERRTTLRNAIRSLSVAFAEVDDRKKRLWLAALALCGAWSSAARAAGVGLGTPWTRQWREYPGMAEAVKRAEAMYGQVLEAEADRRAKVGIWKPVGWHKGKPGGYVRQYSDILLMFRLNGILPDKYKQRIQIGGALATIDVTRLTDDQLARIRAGEHPMSVLGAAALAGASTSGGGEMKSLPAATTEDGEDKR